MSNLKLILTSHSKNIRGANTFKSCGEVVSSDAVLLVVLVVVNREKNEVVVQRDDVVDVLWGEGGVVFLPGEGQSKCVDVGQHQMDKLALIHQDCLGTSLGERTKS